MELNEELIDVVRSFNDLRDSLSDYAEKLLAVYPDAEETELDSAFGDLFGAVRCLGISLCCAGNALSDIYDYYTSDEWYVCLHCRKTYS